MTYPNNSNRIISLHQPGTFSYNANNQLTLAPQTQYQYDANGHTTKAIQGPITRDFIYDEAERLIEVKDNNVSLGQYQYQYQYDPLGRRIQKITPQGAIYFHYSDEGLIAEYDATGTPLAFYGWQPNGTWGTNPQFTLQNNQTYYYHNDHLGTPQKLTDNLGKIVWQGKAEAFGKTTVDPTSTVFNPLRFAGQYEDGETNLHYNFHRDYSSVTGRYVQSDPIGLEGGLNTYAYAKSNPLRWIDSDGLRVQVCSRFVGDWRARIIGARHAWLVITPDNPSQVQCLLGNKGQPTTIPQWIGAYDVNGILTAFPQAPSDDPSTPDSNRRCREIKPRCTGYCSSCGNVTSDSQMIADILSSFNNYGNSLPYDPLARSGYNSNGFAQGLMDSSSCTSGQNLGVGNTVGDGRPVPLN